MTKLSREMKRVMSRMQAGETLRWNYYVNWIGGGYDPPSMTTLESLEARGLVQWSAEWLNEKHRDTYRVYTLTDEGKAVKL